MRIHFITHEKFEQPQAIETWAARHNHTISFSHVYLHEALPSVENFDCLVIMGGPQSTTTTLQECPHFNAPAEIKIIQQAIAAKKLVLGVCLGAQLIGEAYGAPCERSPNKEIGIFPIALNDEGKADPFFADFPAEFSVCHWHGDMPGVPETASILAYSEGCPRQIIRYDNHVYGFQCHMEFTKGSIEELAAHSQEELEVSKNLPYVQDSQKFMHADFVPMHALLFSFLDKFTA